MILFKICSYQILVLFYLHFNEGENLKQLVPELLTVFKDLDLKNSEIIISDDGSTDNTKDILEKIDFKDNVILLERSARPSLPMSI